MPPKPLKQERETTVSRLPPCDTFNLTIGDWLDRGGSFPPPTSAGRRSHPWECAPCRRSDCLRPLLQRHDRYSLSCWIHRSRSRQGAVPPMPSHRTFPLNDLTSQHLLKVERTRKIAPPSYCAGAGRTSRIFSKKTVQAGSFERICIPMAGPGWRTTRSPARLYHASSVSAILFR